MPNRNLPSPDRSSRSGRPASREPARAAPLDTLRMSPEDKQKLVAYVESRGKEVADNRRRLRVDFHGRKVFGRLSVEEGTGPLCSLVPRNLSVRGFAFVHGVFVNVGMRCRLTLPMLGERWGEVSGTVSRCRHLQGIVHEVSVTFDGEIDLADFVHLTPGQKRRIEEEALAGAATRQPEPQTAPETKPRTEHAPEHEPGPAAATAPPPAAGARVMLVDPDATSRSRTEAALAAAGLRVQAFGTNHAARASCEAAPPGDEGPAAILLCGHPGPQRSGVAELRFDPVALAGHLRRRGLTSPILLLLSEGQEAATVQRRAAMAGVTELVPAGSDPVRLAERVVAQARHSAASRGLDPLRSTRTAGPEVAAFAASAAGYRERLRRPGTAERPGLLRGACEELTVTAVQAGFAAVATAAHALQAAADDAAAGRPGVQAAIDRLDGLLRRVEAAYPRDRRAA
ncbi:hypothetical protein [Phycisphaera mikurensis]|uniref:Response regulatory domain-containing protein n=1 Tax=Phycisphaera mikurensis (strain NBRC 102666 / KCTC 22515 / FYK2301M01) TaxID=1142394 RepID=I0IBR6_PHYMF|nr:hypothetical protein [Phycisphaera mikurensis]MBB6442064.1 CheY-like chemotaxis protein [Phycisphaera mikurensis]BAM02704.1 hypothetical protein PSMK_05450 [Phycisphaera mikurensis NBRC 102666]